MILDTSAVSALADGDSDLGNILRLADEVAVPAIVMGEYLYGVRQSRYRTRYERWLKELISNCRVLRVDLDTAESYATLRMELKQIGQPVPANDLWIAALARQYAFPLISRDRHFDAVPGLTRVDWGEDW